MEGGRFQVVYLECCKNHSAALGLHSVDGCVEYICTNGGMYCECCGCHRNFHYRSVQPRPDNMANHWNSDARNGIPSHNSTQEPDYGEVGVQHQAPTEAPQLVISEPNHNAATLSTTSKTNPATVPNDGGQKRMGHMRFSTAQRISMVAYAMGLGWKMPRKPKDKEDFNSFCKMLGITNKNFMYWLDNTKRKSFPQLIRRKNRR